MRLAIAAGLLAATLLAGCVGDQPSIGDVGAVPAPAPTVNMAGRWMLAEPGARSCGVHFGGGPGIRTGAVQPEGGCPGKFFTARHWAMTQDGQLSINDYQERPLATLQSSDNGFAGKSAAGRPVTLSRAETPG